MDADLGEGEPGGTVPTGPGRGRRRWRPSRTALAWLTLLTLCTAWSTLTLLTGWTPVTGVTLLALAAALAVLTRRTLFPSVAPHPRRALLSRTPVTARHAIRPIESWRSGRPRRARRPWRSGRSWWSGRSWRSLWPLWSRDADPGIAGVVWEDQPDEDGGGEGEQSQKPGDDVPGGATGQSPQ